MNETEKPEHNHKTGWIYVQRKKGKCPACDWERAHQKPPPDDCGIEN